MPRQHRTQIAPHLRGRSRGVEIEDQRHARQFGQRLVARVGRRLGQKAVIHRPQPVQFRAVPDRRVQCSVKHAPSNIAKAQLGAAAARGNRG
jgi:hypothetical protein